ncbi:unnamed protein product [[Candida] boidinii]|nr:unnamed protein product [[Candida] boidinii]
MKSACFKPYLFQALKRSSTPLNIQQSRLSYRSIIRNYSVGSNNLHNRYNCLSSSSSHNSVFRNLSKQQPQSQSQTQFNFRKFSTFRIQLNEFKKIEESIPKTKTKTKTKLPGHYIGLGLFGLIIIGLTASEDFRHRVVSAFAIVERVGVVTVASIKCFYHYGKTLNGKYDSEEEYQSELSKCHKKCALITLKALECNGGIYIKLGQHVSAMTYLLPIEWTDTMIPLQNRCPESDIEDIKKMFEKDTGLKFEEYFEEIDPVPIGVASLAQVHIAKLRENGEKVAVKFQHPSLMEFVPLDIFLTRNVFEWMKEIFPDYSLTWLGDELQESIYVELDFMNEAVNAQKTAEYFKNYKKLTALKVPKVYEARKRILVMEFISGSRLDDLNYLEEHNISRSEVSSCLSNIFNNMIFTPGVGVHCDPHGGNLAIRYIDPSKSDNNHNFEIILYDHGLYRNIPNDMRVNYAKFWLALIDKDQESMRKYGKAFACITDEQFPLLAASITGRDFEHAMTDVTSVRNDDEIDKMTSSLLDDNVILDLMKLLATVPRIVLLILKTNDLTRHLDESLHNPLGQERTFFIMATYCAKTVYIEDCKENDAKYNRWSLNWIVGGVKAWWRYQSRNIQLTTYDILFTINNIRTKYLFN